MFCVGSVLQPNPELPSIRGTRDPSQNQWYQSHYHCIQQAPGSSGRSPWQHRIERLCVGPSIPTWSSRSCKAELCQSHLVPLLSLPHLHFPPPPQLNRPLCCSHQLCLLLAESCRLPARAGLGCLAYLSPAPASLILPGALNMSYGTSAGANSDQVQDLS